MKYYENKICEYLTQNEENLQFAIEIYELVNSGNLRDYIRENFLPKFYEDVKAKLELVLQEQNWKIEITKDAFLIYKENWDDLRINYECYGTDIGYWLGYNYKQFNRNEIDNYLETNQIENIKKDNITWPLFYNFGFDFNDLKVLIKLISNKRFTLIEEFVMKIVEFIKIHHTHLEKINLMTINKK